MLCHRPPLRGWCTCERQDSHASTRILVWRFPLASSDLRWLDSSRLAQSTVYKGSLVPTRIASVSGLRGIVGDGLTPDDVVRFAAAYAVGCAVGTAPILVAHDGRPTAQLLQNAVIAGLTGMGRHVELLGAAPTPTMGLLVSTREAAGGVQISASHNPREYNGLKFFQPQGMVLGPDQGQDMLARFEAGDFPWAHWDRIGKVNVLAPSSVQTPHLRRIHAHTDLVAIERCRFRVVLDANHGAGGQIGATLLRNLGCHVRLLGGEPDGEYDHPLEPIKENLDELSAIVPAIRANVGFALDPDADRLAIIDEKGRYIGEELTLALAVKHRLSQEIGPVVLNLSSSRVTEDLAKAAGAPVFRTPVGEIHVVEAMRREKAIIGGEGNGGVIDPRVGWVRDSFVGMARVLELMATENRPLSQIVDDLPCYTMVKRKFPVGDVAIGELLERITAAYPEVTLDRRDGLRLDWPDAWAHVRASNTEPIVRVIAEAAEPDRAAALAQSLGDFALGGGSRR
jgi:phosphomannomutase